MAKNKYYDPELKELRDKAIIQDLQMAMQDYDDGAILECKNILKQIISAINLFEKEYEL